MILAKCKYCKKDIYWENYNEGWALTENDEMICGIKNGEQYGHRKAPYEESYAIDTRPRRGKGEWTCYVCSTSNKKDMEYCIACGHRH